MRKVFMDQTIENVLCGIFQNTRAENLSDIELRDLYEKVFIYPTNDLFLSERQFIKIKQFLKSVKEQRIYLTQFDGGWNGIYSKENAVYILDDTTNYRDYYDINLFSLSVMFSEKGTWAIFTEETLDNGIGLFAARSNEIEQFMTVFQGCNLYRDKFTADDLKAHLDVE